ncbi:MAG TPA: 4Fe-4S binding protein [Candidatus Aphodovivens avistercoris]|nr:4Fe-4S binding protein [Candidatus Aphodovivens avistercoris]
MHRVIVDTDACRRCGCCVRTCPKGALKLGESAVEVREGCIGCGVCTAACPFGALIQRKGEK